MTNMREFKVGDRVRVLDWYFRGTPATGVVSVVDPFGNVKIELDPGMARTYAFRRPENIELIDERPNTGSIRDLQAKQVEIQKEAHRRIKDIDDQIAEIRRQRGTKIKAPNWDMSNYVEPGRDRRDGMNPHGEY